MKLWFARRWERTSAPLGCASVSVFALVLVLGFAFGVLVPSPSEPTVLASSTPSTSVPVVTQMFDDDHQVEVTPSVEPGPALSLLRGGRVTGVSCQTAHPLESGASVLSLDAIPVLFISTTIPLWRDLVTGVRGDDVTALQAELKRLGRLTREPTGRFDGVTDAAVRSLWIQAGRSDPPAGLARDDVLWLPSPQTVPESCPVTLGEIVDAGTTFATTVGNLQRVTLPSIDTGASDLGPRVVRVGDVTGGIDENGDVTAPEFLAALEASAKYAAWTTSDKKTGILLTMSLTEPVTVTVVPPSAVFGVQGTSGCLVSGGKAITVGIVGSSLGKTYVRVQNDAPISAVELDGAAASTSSGPRCS